MVADVCEFEQVEAVAQIAVEEYGRLDTWVHLAAVGLFAPFDQTQPEEFKRVVDVDLMGQVYRAMAALPHIKREGRGALVHISSVVGNARRPYRALTAPPSTASRASWSRCVSSSCKRGGTASASPTSCRRPSTRRSLPRLTPNLASSPRGSPRSTSRASWSMRSSTAPRRCPGR
jgi:NAD(P)-dependent dehydrogenase (short-subunit alcohol dehydrogenase family)